jgi:hypothetical protein
MNLSERKHEDPEIHRHLLERWNKEVGAQVR